jgi:hypothetical protein
MLKLCFDKLGQEQASDAALVVEQRMHTTLHPNVDLGSAPRVANDNAAAVRKYDGFCDHLRGHSCSVENCEAELELIAIGYVVPNGLSNSAATGSRASVMRLLVADTGDSPVGGGDKNPVKVADIRGCRRASAVAARCGH